MAGKVKRRKVSAIADGGDTTLVRPQADWNDSDLMSEGANGNVAVRDAGQTDGWQLLNFTPGNFTNNTGAALADGDVVAVDGGGTTDLVTGGQVILDDTAVSLRRFVVAKSAPANLVAGLFAVAGPVSAVKATGAIAVREYVRKSATTKTVEGTGVTLGATAMPPLGAIGFALAAAAASVVPVFLFGQTWALPALTAKGDLLTRDASGPVRLAVGTDGQTLVADSAQASGLKYGAGGISVLDRVTADTTVTNTVTETTIYTKSIPGGTLGTNVKLRLHIRLKLTGPTDILISDSILFRFKYGATTLFTSASFLVHETDLSSSFGNLSNEPWVLNFDLAGDGATNAQLAYGEVQGRIIRNNGTTGGAGALEVFFTASASGLANIYRGTAAEDSTAAKTLLVTAQWNNAKAGNVLVMESAFLEQL